MPSKAHSSRLLVGAIGGIVVLCLSGCAGPNGPTPSSTSAIAKTDAAIEPTGTPTRDPASDPTAIVVQVDRLEVVDSAGGVRGSVPYSEPVANMVSVLAAATGAQPVVAAYPAGTEADPGTSYSWGGITLLDPDTAVEPPFSDWYVRVEGPSAAALSIATSAGVRVGQSQAEVEALAPGALTPVQLTDSMGFDVNLDETTVSTSDDGSPLTYSVYVRLQNSPTVATIIIAPSQNWGG